MKFNRLDELIDLAKSKKTKKLVVTAAQDRPVLLAIKTAEEIGIIQPVLVGHVNKIKKICKEIGLDSNKSELINEEDPNLCCQTALEIIRQAKADILMKGLVSTAPLLKAILDKENGLRKSEVLSHFALFEVPTYPKLLGVTDAAINIRPTIKEKISIIRNAIEVYHRLGNPNPKVAIISPVEVVNPKIESTVHASMISIMNRRNQIEGCTIDGPLAIDNAVSTDAARHKCIESPVAGKADILVAPDLNSGNILYKTLVFLAGSISAAIVMGASIPIVLTSRADSEKSKLMSIALAAAMD